MARSFRGQFEQKVDAKGRVAMPPAYRRVLEACDPDWKEGLRPQFVIVFGDHRRKYLECFSMEGVFEVDARIAKMDHDDDREEMEHLMTGQALATDLDKDGRLILTPMLREKIGLERDAFFIASGDRFQIWKPEVYQSERLAKSKAYLDEKPENFRMMSLLPPVKEE